MLALWAASVVMARRIKHSRLLRLDLVIGVSLVLAVISMARIFGHLWFYLMLWSWSISALVLFAIVWTAVEVVRGRIGSDARTRVLKAGTAVAGAFIVVSSVALAADARNVDPPAPELSSVLASVMPPTEQALLDHKGSATGRDGRYSVTWSDALYIGSQGYGIVLELERQGFTAGRARLRTRAHDGITRSSSRPMRPRSSISPPGSTSTNGARSRLRSRWPSTTRVSLAQQAEFARLRSEVIPMLHAAGLDDLVPHVDDNLFGAAIDDRLTSPENQPIQERLQSMLDLGLPTAIFVAPPGTVAP